MQIKKIASSTVIIETKDTSILCDPWIENGEYYGSWSISEELILRQNIYKEMNECENVYISHIHPDHFSKKTLNKIEKNKKVFIHKYESPFLKKNLENLGFKNIVEVENGETVQIKGKTNLTIFAADNCDPNICKKFMGCNYSDGSKKSQQIDSCALIHDEKKTILNLNDCMEPMMNGTIKKIKNKFKIIDILLVNYNSAHSYPQNIANIIDEKKYQISEEIKKLTLSKTIKYLESIEPIFFIPFAGEYTISGRNFPLNKFKGTNSQNECYDFFNESKWKKKLIMLNYGSKFDGSSKVKFRRDNELELREYNQKLVEMEYDYDFINTPSKSEIEDMSFIAFKKMMIKLNLKFNHTLYIKYFDKLIFLDFDNNLIKFTKNTIEDKRDFTILKLDEKLLFLLLKGPKYAHWNNADIGSHISYTRSDLLNYNYRLFNSISYFHC